MGADKYQIIQELRKPCNYYGVQDVKSNAVRSSDVAVISVNNGSGKCLLHT